MNGDEGIIEGYKTLYDVVIPDLDYYLRQIDCRDGCPVKTDGRGYMMAIHRGDLLEGYKIARGPNPFASICGIIKILKVSQVDRRKHSFILVFLI